MTCTCVALNWYLLWVKMNLSHAQKNEILVPFGVLFEKFRWAPPSFSSFTEQVLLNLISCNYNMINNPGILDWWLCFDQLGGGKYNASSCFVLQKLDVPVWIKFKGYSYILSRKHSSIHSLIHSSICSFIRPSVLLSVHSSIHPFIQFGFFCSFRMI